jgi:hypothetical protein
MTERTPDFKTLQARLLEAGVRNVQFTFIPTIREDVASGKVSVDDVKRDAHRVLTAYMDGKTTEFTYTFDEDGNKVYAFDECVPAEPAGDSKFLKYPE